ncbi:MAG: hypothetical protein FWG84_05395 [Bacteroidales bacterium]|nr:hypothetical protein [Bacteroidales bacterium]
MNVFKKTILLFLCSLVATPWLMAQEKKPIKHFYAVEANLGISMRKEASWEGQPDYSFSDDAKLSYKALVYGCNFMGGVELKHYFKVGLGIGYSYYKQEDNRFFYRIYDQYVYYLTPESVTTHRIPLYLYLRSDFLDQKKSPFIDFKIGNNFLITKEIINFSNWVIKGDNYGKVKLKNGLFVAANVGVAFKGDNRNAINISVGYQSVSKNYDFWNYAHGIDSDKEYIKTGYTVIDHQFLFNLGISF